MTSSGTAGASLPQDSAPEPKALAEAALFQHREPLPPARLARALGTTPEGAVELLEELAKDYETGTRGLVIRRVAGGYLLLAKPECLAQLGGQFVKPRPPLSSAALETLALIAYRQPVTAAEVMQTRGVHTPGVLETLLDRKLIRTAGRRKTRGNPILYKTTPEFLVEFGLEDLDHLPPLDKFRPKGAGNAE
jgi:segregation and condensation protein B